jgi:hypothetical protein
MAMIEFEDHSEENQKALLAYLAREESDGGRVASRSEARRAVARLFARLRSWFAGLF